MDNKTYQATNGFLQEIETLSTVVRSYQYTVLIDQQNALTADYQDKMDNLNTLIEKCKELGVDKPILVPTFPPDQLPASQVDTNINTKP